VFLNRKKKTQQPEGLLLLARLQAQVLEAAVVVGETQIGRFVVMKISKQQKCGGIF
jgi:hypothetical protein